MCLTIDDIYDLFSWDASYSDEEYNARVERGLAEARKLRNIYPFIQPIIVPMEKSKSVWEPCAKVIALKSDEELKPFLCMLFEWLQDMNWPGADIIFNRLTRIPFSKLESDFQLSRKRAEAGDDEVWLEWLEEFEAKAKASSTGQST